MRRTYGRTRRRVGGVGIGVSKAIGARVGHTRTLDGGDGSVGLGVDEAFGAPIEHEADVESVETAAKLPLRLD